MWPQQDTPKHIDAPSDTDMHTHSLISEVTAVPTAPTVLIHSINLDTECSCTKAVSSNKTKQLSAPRASRNCWTDAWKKGYATYFVWKVDFSIILFWWNLFLVWALVYWEVKRLQNAVYCVRELSTRAHLSQAREMLHSTVLQWPCNAILYAGPSGQILLASISCWRDQRSTFSLGLLWKTWERSGDDSVFIAEGHLHTRLFPVLRCPSQVDLTGQHRPLTSWIMHYGHTLYSRVSYLVAGCLCCGRFRLFVLKCNTVSHELQSISQKCVVHFYTVTLFFITLKFPV